MVVGWNGMAIQAFAAASVVLQQEDPPQGPAFPVEGRAPSQYLQAAIKVEPQPSQRQPLRPFCLGAYCPHPNPSPHLRPILVMHRLDRLASLNVKLYKSLPLSSITTCLQILSALQLALACQHHVCHLTGMQTFDLQMCAPG